jgi:flagellar protein FlaI
VQLRFKPLKFRININRKRDKGKDKGNSEVKLEPVQNHITNNNLTQPVFREHYPLLEPYSRAAIVEETGGRVRYLLLEPTLTHADESWINQIKGILWDELTMGTKEFKDKKEAEEFLKKKVEDAALRYEITVDPFTLEKYQYYITRDFLNFGKIDGLMRDERIEDISCDGFNVPIYVWHREYESMPSNIIFETQEELENFILKLAYKCNRQISLAQPLLDGTLPDGSRAQLTFGKEVTPKGSTFTIRKFKRSPLTITDLISYKTLSPELGAYFWMVMENRHSIMIGGDIGGGKTTMLNAFSLFIRPNLKICSIEDTQEIRLPHENWQMMVTRQGLGAGSGAIGETGKGSIGMFDLLRAAFRQRPDYIIVGEIRGEEAYALFQAMSTGHLGLTTIHAEHIQGVLHRLTTKPMSIPHTLIENLDAIAIVRRLVVDTVPIRRTMSVCEMLGWDDKKNDFKIHEAFSWDAKADAYCYSGKSYLMEEIAHQRGCSSDELETELEKRKVILNYMVRKGIRTYEDVSAVVMSYFSDPDALFRKAKVS